MHIPAAQRKPEQEKTTQKGLLHEGRVDFKESWIFKCLQKGGEDYHADMMLRENRTLLLFYYYFYFVCFTRPFLGLPPETKKKKMAADSASTRKYILAALN
ncbi:hypothetical protein TcG_02995 [Trypanosoma cruzi]|nr:hypothetical protein TcG_02995 [Trypanosoma cruzi]